MNKRNAQKCIVFLFSFFISFVLWGGKVSGQELLNKNIEELLEELDYSKIQKIINKTDNKKNIDFEEEVNKVVSTGKIDYKKIIGNIRREIKNSWENNKSVLLRIMVITVGIAIFNNFAKTMECQYVSQTSFMMTYMMLMLAIIDVFKEVFKIGNDTLCTIKNFITALLPTYSIASIIGSGFNTATAFSQLAMIVIVIVESVFLKILLPMINIYMVLVIVNNMCNVNGMTKVTELIKTGIKWGTKGAVIAVTSMSTVQKLLSSKMDVASRKVFETGMGAIPYVGNSMENINETLFNSVEIIKNAIGIVGIVALITICLIPVVHIVIYVFIYSLLAAVVEPISDTRVVNCIKSVADGGKLVLEVIVTSLGMFFITIALMSV